MRHRGHLGYNNETMSETQFCTRKVSAGIRTFRWIKYTFTNTLYINWCLNRKFKSVLFSFPMEWNRFTSIAAENPNTFRKNQTCNPNKGVINGRRFFWFCKFCYLQLGFKTGEYTWHIRKGNGCINWFLGLRLMNTQIQIPWGKLFAGGFYFRYTRPKYAKSNRNTVDKYIWQKPVSIINHLQKVSINNINMHSSTIQCEIQPNTHTYKCTHHFRLFHVGASKSIISHRNSPSLLSFTTFTCPCIERVFAMWFTKRHRECNARTRKILIKFKSN